MSGDATFLQRLRRLRQIEGREIGSVRREETNNVCNQTIRARLGARRAYSVIFDTGDRSRLFTAVISMLVAFDGFTVSSSTNQNDYRTPSNKPTAMTAGLNIVPPPLRRFRTHLGFEAACFAVGWKKDRVSAAQDRSYNHEIIRQMEALDA